MEVLARGPTDGCLPWFRRRHASNYLGLLGLIDLVARKDGALEHIARVAWYRFRCSLRRQWSAYITIVILVSSIGGVALTSAAAARRTESSFPAFLASTNPSNLLAVPAPPSPLPNYSLKVTKEMTRLHDVERIESAVFLSVFELEKSGDPNRSIFQGGRNAVLGSIDGLFFHQDRPAVVEGRMANPSDPDEVVMTAGAAKANHLHLGSIVPLAFYSAAQEDGPSFGTAKVQPILKLDVRVVGIVVLNLTVVQDSIDRTNWTIFTPALTKHLLTAPLSNALGWTMYGLQLRNGNADIPKVEREISDSLAKGTFLLYHDYSIVESEAQHAIAPEVIAFGAFALIAALALLLVALQATSRLVQRRTGEREVLRALGASPWMINAGELVGVVGSLAVGTVLALVIAILLSPLAPVGPVRPVYPNPGFNFDWSVLGLGGIGLFAVLVVLALVLVVRAAPERNLRRAQALITRGSSTVRAAASAGLAASAVEGVRFALVPGHGRTAVPVRSVMLGATLAVVILTTTLIFGSSLQSLVDRPSLYGWNFTYALDSTIGIASTPSSTSALLRHDPKVVAWNSVLFYEVQFNGVVVPTMVEPSSASVAPPQLTGHAVRNVDQVVLGPDTLAALHKRVGDTVVATYSGVLLVKLKIVGTATFASIGLNLSLHPSLGVGAVVSNQLLGKALSAGAGCGQQTQMLLVRYRPGVSAATSLKDSRRITSATNRYFAKLPQSSGCVGDSFAVLDVERPAEIVNYRSMGSTPVLLGALIAFATLAALEVMLVASVRRRRRDLAILKTLGFKRRQLSSAVAWQASVTMAIGVVVGEPIGIVLGRWLWSLFARAICVVPEPSVPWMTLVLVALGSMVFVNVAAAIPGRIAASTPTALVLRSE